MDDVFSGAGGGTPCAHAGRSSAMRALDFDIAMKSMLGASDKGTSSTRDGFIGWKPEQQSDELLHSFLGETGHSSFGAGNDSGRRRGVPSANDVAFGRTLGTDVGDSVIQSRGQSVIEAVTAAASGEGGWGMRGPSPANLLGGGDAIPEEFDPSLLLNTIASESQPNVPRQGPPPGLSVFTPQIDKHGLGGDEENRQRDLTLSGRHGLGSAGLRGAGVAGSSGLKQIDELESLQRLVATKSNKDSSSAPGHMNGRVGTHRNDLLAGVQLGRAEQNGANVVPKSATQKTDTAAKTKEPLRNSAGQRRGTQRKASGGGEGREKRPKTNASSTDQH